MKNKLKKGKSNNNSINYVDNLLFELAKKSNTKIPEAIHNKIITTINNLDADINKK